MSYLIKLDNGDIINANKIQMIESFHNGKYLLSMSDSDHKVITDNDYQKFCDYIDL